MNAIRLLLTPASWLYGLGVMFRNWCYDRRLLTIADPAVPVISVGNITAGGSGKTPFVEYLIRFFGGYGKRIAVLSRGYRRSTSGYRVVSDGETVQGDAVSMGDEPYQIARKFPGIIVAVDEDRVRGARTLNGRFHPDVILLDDGYQHRRLGRRLDIVMIGAGQHIPDIPLLPAGMKREPVSSLRRADAIVCHEGKDAVSAAVIRGWTDAPVISARYLPKRFIRSGSGEPVDADALRKLKLVAVSGIASPASFRASLAEMGIEPAGYIEFPDHHRFTPEDLDNRIAALMHRTGADGIVTTEKDAVRLEASPGWQSRAIPCWYLEIELSVVNNEETLHGLLLRALEDERS